MKKLGFTTHHSIGHGMAAALFLLACLCQAGSGNEVAETILASDGKTSQAVITAPGATERVKTAAAELAEYLGRISGASFEVREGDGLSGLAVGMPEDFPNLPERPDFHPDSPTGREDYLLRTHANGVYLLGATEIAVEHAVWDFLYRLGYRQFFPGRTWEVIPRIDDLKVRLDTLQRPDFYSRRLGSGASRGPEAFGDREAYDTWMRRNRIAAVWRIHSSHAYQSIRRRLEDEFEKHPEYLGLVNGERVSDKFCISNPGLRALIVDYALAQFDENPERESISMEPSDGGGWCECEDCAAMGTISTRVITLANEVAEAINQVHTNKYVGILAYNHHCAPPEIQVHPNVMVSIATGHLTDNWDPMDLFAGWAAQGAGGFDKGFGVGEYYSIIIRNRYLPGLRASNIAYIRRTIPEYYRLGARRFGGAASYGNGAVALGMYIASRILWDLSEADRVDDLYQDFLEKSFGPAAEPMDEFFRHIYRFEDDAPRMRLTEDKVGRMYRALAEAMPLADTEEVRGRIQDMILYARYMELSLGDDYGDVLRHAWRTRDRMLVNTYGLFIYPPGPWLEGQLWRMPANENPYKEAAPPPTMPDAPDSPAAAAAQAARDSILELDADLADLFGQDTAKEEKNIQRMPFSDEEIASILKHGVENNRVGTFQIKDFSMDLVPAAAALNFKDEPLGRHNFGLSLGGRRVFYTWVDEAPGEIKLRIAGGFIWPKRATNVVVSLFSDKASADDDFLVMTDRSIPPDQQERELILKTPYDGLHRIEIEGGPGATTVEPATEGMTFTVQAGPERFFRTRFVWEGWFYVPVGTKEVSFHVASPNGEILDREGFPIFSFRRPYMAADESTVEPESSGGYYTIPVPPGKDGTLWKLSGVRGAWLLLNVPPYIARRPSELLLPREVVEADMTGNP